MGGRDPLRIVTLAECQSSAPVVAKLPARTNGSIDKLFDSPNRKKRSARIITVENGGEFHQIANVENEAGAQFYFSTPRHS